MDQARLRSNVIRRGGGRCRAWRRASVTSAVCLLVVTRQPRIRREKTSTTNAT